MWTVPWALSFCWVVHSSPRRAKLNKISKKYLISNSYQPSNHSRSLEQISTTRSKLSTVSWYNRKWYQIKIFDVRDLDQLTNGSSASSILRLANSRRISGSFTQSIGYRPIFWDSSPCRQRKRIERHRQRSLQKLRWSPKLANHLNQFSLRHQLSSRNRR